ncbi:hypothetical protein HCH_01204 [Hahella chejuensis KCTC 2396]|uniref:Uncharacterized protein n=1 Tax=Hahella chejuensis (strain KCTC 2396) TaxID=349521 RepID=Q2SMP7_HAHCH|nr:hypothetical protein [Hahella chejuensis]ABC28077.1 hypothetical protein HCH_01204 [Hahella chejuensis KCTC 2396]
MGSSLIDGVKHHFSSLSDPRRETLNMRHNFYMAGPGDLYLLRNYVQQGQKEAGLKVQQNSGIWNLDGVWGLIDNGN